MSVQPITQLHSIYTSTTELDLGYRKDLTSSEILKMIKDRPTLENLNLTRCQGGNCTNEIASDTDLIEFLEHCPNLKALNLSCCPQMSSVVIKAAARYCRKLELIDINGCLQITRDAIDELKQNCPNLRELHAVGCADITEDADEGAQFRIIR